MFLLCHSPSDLEPSNQTRRASIFADAGSQGSNSAQNRLCRTGSWVQKQDKASGKFFGKREKNMSSHFAVDYIFNRKVDGRKHNNLQNKDREAGQSFFNS